VDTFETAEKPQAEFGFFNPENTERVKRQKAAPIFVVLGNPPYNANQLNENDNNKNRKYEVVGARVQATYVADSQATLRNKVSGDPYVKAYRWATDRIGREGIVAYVSNNGFLDDKQFDGMRKHLAQDFDAIYIVDLGAKVRRNPELSGTTHNVFGIQLGVSINLLVRGGKHNERPGRIYYHAVPNDWRREQRLRFIEERKSYASIKWMSLKPDERHNWLTADLRGEFDTFAPVSIPRGKRVRRAPSEIFFDTYSLGVSTNRDETVYCFDHDVLAERVRKFITAYNREVARYLEAGRPKNVDDFVNYDVLKWSSTLKKHLAAGVRAKFVPEQIRTAVYRPFATQYVYYDALLIDRPGLFFKFLPAEDVEGENRVLWLKTGAEVPFFALLTNRIPNLLPQGGSQCFPFYTYEGEAGARRENISDAMRIRFQQHYNDGQIAGWDIFHYVYAVLHHPEYRARYAANLRRELPRIPLVGNDAKVFHAYAEVGRKLADLHVNYESVAEYPLQRIENPELPLDWRVKKMRLSKDKTAIVYNDFLTLAGVPEAAFAYRLGNRSALEWVIDQYQVSTDARSGITNDPNRADEPDYIVKLVGRVITVSLETQKLIAVLPALQVS
jgi:predicted helicase